MSRITRKINQRHSAGQGAFVAFITAGDPNLEATEELVLALDRAGVDVVELGVPFSDPMADGPSIQASSQRALRHGITVGRVFDLVGCIRQRSAIPIVLMTYYNPMLQCGLEAFAKGCAWVGVDGVIATDLTPEEAGPWKKAAVDAGIDTIFLVAPTSTDERMRLIAGLAGGFIYCVSRTGVTGARERLPEEDLHSLISRIRAHTDLPVIVGFGISTPKQVAAVTRVADGVVVGSALVNVIAQHQEDPSLVRIVETVAAELRAGCG
jgi:tryptophan synthase alpha chain